MTYTFRNRLSSKAVVIPATSRDIGESYEIWTSGLSSYALALLSSGPALWTGGEVCD